MASAGRSICAATYFTSWRGLSTTAYKQDKSASGHLLTSRDPATSASTRSRPSPRALHAVYASTQPAPRSALPSPLSRSPPFHTALHTHKRRQGDKVTQFKLRHRNKAELRKTERREETPPPSTVAPITKLRAGSRRRRLSNMYTKARSNFDTSQIQAPESKRKRRNIIFRVLGKNPKMGFALQLILFNRRQNYSSIARPAPPGVQLELAAQLRIWPLAFTTLLLLLGGLFLGLLRLPNPTRLGFAHDFARGAFHPLYISHVRPLLAVFLHTLLSFKFQTLDSSPSSGLLKLTSGGPSDCVNYGKPSEQGDLIYSPGRGIQQQAGEPPLMLANERTRVKLVK
ncbi:hypothetical protein B0H13DRAFT_1866808 [Mycena leptocephala]|nr:hypothetical protein B0H13DRAFT_1866808 [Mycena leptocephala]